MLSSSFAAFLLLASCFYTQHAAVWDSNAKNNALCASCSAETGAMPIVAIELTNPATKKTRVFSPVKDRPEVWEVSLTTTHEHTCISAWCSRRSCRCEI